MEKERVLIATDSMTLKNVLKEIFRPETNPEIRPDFENDKLTKLQAAKLAGVSLPTLSKLVKEGKFKQYNIGRRVYFLRSEIIEALTK